MSMLQRLLNTQVREKEGKNKAAEPQVEELTDGQPHNPYTEILILQQHSDIVRLLIALDSNRCISAGDDGKAVVWDIKNGHRLAVLSGHKLPVTCVLYLPGVCDDTENVKGENSDDLVLTGSCDKTIRIWDVESGQCRQILTVEDSIRCMVDLQKKELFCSGGEHLSLWNRYGKLLCVHRLHDEEQEDISMMVAIKDDHIITASDKQLVVYSVVMPSLDQDPSAREINLIKKLPPLREAIHSLIILSDSCFASGSIDGTIVLWTCHNLLPAKYLNTVEKYQGPEKLYPYSIQYMFCLDERYLFAAIGSGFGVFDIAARSERLLVRKLAAHYSKILHMSVACEGAYLVTCSEDGTIRLWGRPPPLDTSDHGDRELTLSTMERLTGLSMEELKTRAFDDPLEPTLLGECLAHSGAVEMFLDFNLEGLVSCGADGLVILWKNSERQKVKRNQLAQELVGIHSKQQSSPYRG